MGANWIRFGVVLGRILGRLEGRFGGNDRSAPATRPARRRRPPPWAPARPPSAPHARPPRPPPRPRRRRRRRRTRPRRSGAAAPNPRTAPRTPRRRGAPERWGASGAPCQGAPERWGAPGAPRPATSCGGNFLRGLRRSTPRVGAASATAPADAPGGPRLGDGADLLYEWDTRAPGVPIAMARKRAPGPTSAARPVARAVADALGVRPAASRRQIVHTVLALASPKWVCEAAAREWRGTRKTSGRRDA